MFLRFLSELSLPSSNSWPSHLIHWTLLIHKQNIHLQTFTRNFTSFLLNSSVIFNFSQEKWRWRKDIRNEEDESAESWVVCGDLKLKTGRNPQMSKISKRTVEESCQIDIWTWRSSYNWNSSLSSNFKIDYNSEHNSRRDLSSVQ